MNPLPGGQMGEHPDHIPTHTGSGTAKCSCGWTSEHFSHDDDLWESFDVHVTDALQKSNE